MKFVGNFAEQNIIVDGDYKKLYIYTTTEQREVILYYTLKEQCCVLKQIAICSEITECYSMYWVFVYEYVNDTLHIDDFKKTCLKIVEEEILPYIQAVIY